LGQENRYASGKHRKTLNGSLPQKATRNSR
jgi:hypothetical protein